MRKVSLVIGLLSIASCFCLSAGGDYDATPKALAVMGGLVVLGGVFLVLSIPRGQIGFVKETTS